MLRIEKIEGVIWDMDGVLHPYIPFTQSLPHWNGAAVRAFNTVANNLGIQHQLSDEELLTMANESFKNLGLSTAIFSRNYGAPELDMHIEFHRETRVEDVITAYEDLPARFAATPHLKHIVLTHGSEEWAERCLQKNGLRQYFSGIVSFEHADMLKKSASDLPFKKALDIAQLPAESVIMVEDTMKNLIIPKQMGMQTLFIEENGLEPEWLQQPTDCDDYIDEIALNASSLLKALAFEPSR